MEYKVIVAGFGGQGVLFAGKVMAHAAAELGLETSWLPSYGPEMRGGTANCRIVISDEPICSPAVSRADALIAMNMPSLMRFKDVTRGVIVTDARFARFCETDSRVIGISTELCGGGAAHEGLVNMVMTGALCAVSGLIPAPAVRGAIMNITSGEAQRRDLAAAEYGMAAVRLCGTAAERVC